MRKRVILAFGTRPEAIKMAPVYRALAARGVLEPLVVLTGQHRTQLDQALEIFQIPVAADLAAMTHCQDLPELAARILPPAARLFRELGGHYVLVHGDTLTTFVSAWAAFLERIPVGHVEAGLRSGSLAEPFPEEANRMLTDVLADLYFAPTQGARQNLLSEGVPAERIRVTGQTAVDAVVFAAQRGTLPPGLDVPGPLVAVTLHRRENWPLLPQLGEALAEVARCHPGWTFVVPLHLNPLVRRALVPALAGVGNVKVMEPLEYGQMAALLARCRLIVTDSGGLQEEGASLGVPVAVVRNVTERPEGVAAGIVTLLGTDPAGVREGLEALLDDSARLETMASSPNPFGDGRASERIAQALEERLQLSD